MATNGPLKPEDLLDQVEEFLVTVPEAARILRDSDPDEAWYAVKVRRLIQGGDLPATRVGGEHSEGYYLIDRRELESLLSDSEETGDEKATGEDGDES